MDKINVDKLKPENKDTPKTPPSPGIVYDNGDFREFDKTFRYSAKSLQKALAQNSVTRLSNRRAYSLGSRQCFKQMNIADNDDLQRCLTELAAHRRLHTQDTAKLYIDRKSPTEFPQTARLVMRYHAGEDLDAFMVDEEDDTVGFMFEHDFRDILRKILLELNRCHSNGVLHCDIKPGNIIVNEQSGTLKETDPEYYAISLVDFGFAHVFDDIDDEKTLRGQLEKGVRLSVIKGTPGFIAPETIQSKRYSAKTDMFAVGCVAFFLLTNHFAVEQSYEMDAEEMMPDRKRLRRILQRENEVNRDEETLISDGAIDFVMSCLWRKPSKRPTAAEALKHEIFEKL